MKTRAVGSVSFLAAMLMVTVAAQAEVILRLQPSALAMRGTLSFEKVNQQMGALPTARVAGDKGIYAKAKTTPTTLTLEFIEPLAAGTKTITLASDVALNEADSDCAIKAGTYTIDFARVKNGIVTLPIYDSPALQSVGHKRRQSRRLLG